MDTQLKALMIQPGAYGDIFVCAPIAKWYADRGYEVHWPVRKQFISTLVRFPYVTPILLPERTLDADWLRSDVMQILPMVDEYDMVINLADRGPHPTAQRPGENFEQCKYRMAGVPIEEKYKLSYNKDMQKEMRLFQERVANVFQDPYVSYAVAHREDSHGTKAEMPKIWLPVVDIVPVEGYDIVDWGLVIACASEVYCVESGVHQFMDGIGTAVPNRKYLLRRESVPENCKYTLSPTWHTEYMGINVKTIG